MIITIIVILIVIYYASAYVKVVNVVRLANCKDSQEKNAKYPNEYWNSFEIEPKSELLITSEEHKLLIADIDETLLKDEYLCSGGVHKAKVTKINLTQITFSIDIRTKVKYIFKVIDESSQSADITLEFFDFKWHVISVD